MKNNIWDKKVIGFDDEQNLCREYTWSTRVHFVFLI
jgi:hypothetical protein